MITTDEKLSTFTEITSYNNFFEFGTGKASTAAFVEFTTLLRPKEMPGQRGSSLNWPYTEGLRLDEAMHPSRSSRSGCTARR